jgi:hypothetical protein
LSELNGAFKLGVTKTEKAIYNAKPDSLKGKWKMTDIIPVVNGAYATSYCRVDKCKKAVTDRGWGPLNYALLQHPEVIKTKPVTTNDELTLESDPVETTASAVSTVMGMNLSTVTLNITKGAVGKATDTIVLSEVKSIGTKKACNERRAREEDIATSSND